ncbi:MAG TPA: hypothetical protein PKA00_01785 [Saprospiraceae bacterium]|nr:hypothetical protein [Saprospiraceae bacterium]HMQ81601.1 hypothetical protein [Saprospiraceae bacterium]
MSNRFLYIDDAAPDIRNATASGLSSSGFLIVTAEEPLAWDTRTSRILGNIAQIEGVILDWRLTEETNRTGVGVGGTVVKYSAEALAQHLRFLATEGEIKDIPIVLCSANQGFKEYYRRDSTGHNLFDEVFEKNDFAEHHEIVVRQLNCLAEAYKILQTEQELSLESIFANPTNIEIDVRLAGNISTFLGNMVPHELIGFLQKEIIKKPGILINEDILAARLGIDKDASDEWNTLLETVINPNLKYEGLLSDGWTRWWADGLIQWWKRDIHPTHPQLRAAKQRVKLIKEKTGVQGLVPAEKLKFCAESEFWTVCVATKKPLATSEGLRVQVTNEQPWQDEQYVSLFAILERINHDSYKLNPIEKERLANLKRMLKA